MAQAGDNLKQWLLIGEYYDQKLADGLSPHAAEQAIRREGHQRQFDYRCHDEACHQVVAPANLWIAGTFDFPTNSVTVPNLFYPSAQRMAEIARQAQSVQAAVDRMLGRNVAQKEDSGSSEIPRQQDNQRFFLEVSVEARPVAPIQADAERHTGIEPVNSNLDVERNTDVGPDDPTPTNAVKGVDSFRTGSAGRPSAKEFIQIEFKRRLQDGEIRPVEGGLAACARTLVKWWEAKRRGYDPPGPSVTPGTIENMIRELWRAAVGGAQNPPDSR
jgi:hypothetical protein